MRARNFSSFPWPPPFFLFFSFLGILQRYTYYVYFCWFVFFFGYLACWTTDISDSAAGRLGAARLPLVLMTERRAEQSNGPGLIAATAAARLELYASLAPRSPSLVENSISQMREMRKARKV